MNHTLDILRNARGLLYVGWCQRVNSVRHANGYGISYCLVGAIYAGGCSQEEGHKACMAVHACIPEHSRAQIGVTAWNDMLGRTKADVLALVDEAINVELSK